MKVTVLGKAHISGTSKKSGQPYNCSVVYFNAPARGVEGVRGESLWLDYKEYPTESIRVGGVYDFETYNGSVLHFTEVK